MSYETKRLEELFKYFNATSDSIGNDIDSYEGYQPDLARVSLDPVLNALAQIGCYRLNCDRAFISLIDDESQYVVAEATQSISLYDSRDHQPANGLCIGARRLDLVAGVCAGTMPAFTGELAFVCTENVYADRTRYVINDFSKDPHYSERPYVTGFPHMRYYAEVPITSQAGYVLGTYALVDNKPRVGLDEAHYKILAEIASSIMRHLEMVKLKEDHRKASRLLRGLNSFVQDDTDGNGKSVSKWKASKDIEPGALDHASPDEAPSLTRKMSAKNVSDDLQSAAGSSVRGSSVPTASATTMSSEPTKPDTADIYPNMEAGRMNSDEEENSGIDDVSGPTVEETQHEKTGALLRDSVISNDIRLNFLRASHLLRAAMDLDGVIFLDAAPTHYACRSPFDMLTSPFDPPGLRKGHSPTTSEDEIQREVGQSEKLRPLSEINPETKPLRDTEVMISHVSDSQTRLRMAGRLGYSTRTIHGSAANVISPDHLSLPEKVHQSLLRRYPKGHVFNFGQDRTPASTPLESHEDPTTAEDPMPSHKGEHPRPGNVKHRRAIEDAIRQHLPDARSVIFMPLWNPHKESWFAGSLGWTMNDKRVLQSEDFAYFSVFGNSIMAEVTRLELLATDQAKSDFISSISHELRSPLHGILGSAELLKESIIDVEQQQMIGMVESCGRTLLDTMDHILDFSKINSIALREKRGRKHAAVSPQAAAKNGLFGPKQSFDLSVLVEETVESLVAGHRFAISTTAANSGSAHSQSHASLVPSSNSKNGADGLRKSVTVILHIDSGSSWLINSEPTAWRRVILNLLGNALKYTGSGFIEVTLESANGAKVPKSGPPTNVVALTVNDTGCGIGKTFLQTHLYTPFVQENVLSNGTGLGLSIVQKIINGLGGTLDIQSEVGVGTQVSVLLPVTSVPPRAGLTSRVLQRHVDRSICLLGFDTYPDLDATPTGVLPITSKLMLSQRASLEKHAKQWMGMNVVSAATVDQIGAERQCDIIAINEDKLHLLEVDSRNGGKDIRVPNGSSLVILCQDHSKENRLKSGALDRVQYLLQPFGPRKLAESVETALKQTTTSTAEIPYHPERLSVTQRAPSQPIAEAGSPTMSVDEPIGSVRQKASTQLSPPPIPFSDPPTPTTSKVSDLGSRPHLLLVEDNDVNLNILVKCVGRLNCTYATATNGLEALKAFRASSAKPFDFILMDVSMPVMDGFAATRAIRDFEKQQRHNTNVVKVIALTGLGSAKAQQEAFTSGVDLFLTKPVKMAEVRRLVDEGFEALMKDRNGES